MWSYFPGWNTGGVCPYTGYPVNCTIPQMLAVGARNPAAPPWEGRMMRFPATNDLATQETTTRTSPTSSSRRGPTARRRSRACSRPPYYLLERPERPGEEGPARLVRQPPAVHHRLDRRRAEPRPATRLQQPHTERRHCRPVPVQDAGRHRRRDERRRWEPTPITTYVIGFAVSSATIDSTLYQCATLAQNGSLAAVCNPGPLDPPERCGQRLLRAPEDRARGVGEHRHQQRRHAEPEPDAGLLRRHAGRAAEGALRHPREHRQERDDPHGPGVRGEHPGHLRRSEQPDDGRLAVPGVVQPVARQAADGRIVRSRDVCQQAMAGRTRSPSRPPTRPRATTPARTSTRTRATRGRSSPSSPIRRATGRSTRRGPSALS